MTIALPRLGFGAAPIGNLYREMTDADARAVIDTAWDGGVRCFDTAPHYGLGLSERRLGAALHDRPRDEYVISTKVGRLLEPWPEGAGQQDDEGFAVPATTRRRWDFSAAGVRRSLEESLQRLGLDRVDVLYLHDPEDHLEQALNEGLPELVALRDAGVVGAIGVGSTKAPALQRVAATGLADLVMVAGRYTLLEQSSAAELLATCTATDTGVVAVGVFNSGLLATPTPTAASPYEYGSVPPDILARALELARVCEEHGVELPHAALQFPYLHESVVNVTVGWARPEHVESSLRWAATPVPTALWRDLRQGGLIPA